MVGEPHSETNQTRRGDRAARRREVLAAAADVLEEQDWADFSIREVARRVGVSPGAVYLWFASKQEIIAHLQAARLRRDAATVRALADDTAPDILATEVTSLLARMYAEIGRYPLDLTPGGDPAAGATELRAALSDAIEAIHSKAEAVLATDGTELRDLRARLAWLWASAQGIGDHLSAQLHDVHGVSREDFLRVAGERTAAGLLAEDAVPS